MSDQKSAPGWYPQGNEQRYWDGNQWTDQRAPLAQQYAGPPPKKSHTLRNVLLVLIGLAVLGVGGCFAVVGMAANEVSDSIEKDANKSGGTDNPKTITPGKAFEVDGFNYAAGWRLVDNFGLDVKGLKVTNNRSEKDSAIVEIKLWRGSEVLAVADCTTEPIAVDTTTSVTCLSGDKLPKSYDKVTINDTF